MKQQKRGKDIYAIVDLGGLNFQDKSYLGSLRTYFRYSFIGRNREKLYFFTQDMGPADSWVTRELLKRTIKKAAGVICRSKTTSGILDSLGLRDKILGVFPDSALSLEAVSHPNYSDFSNYVAIVPNENVLFKEGDEYIERLKCYAEKALSLKYCVVIVTHSYQNAGDSSLAFELKRRLNGNASVVDDKNLSPSELKSIIGSASLTICSRYHAVVASLSKGVPCITIGWNHKYESLAKLFHQEAFLDELGEEGLIDLRAVLNSKSTLNQVKDSVVERSTIAYNLIKHK